MENTIRISSITIQGWMVTELGLKGNDLLIYALIFGFSKDGESKFYGSRRYIAKWFNLVPTSVDNILKNLVSRDLIIKCTEEKNGVISNHYKANLNFVKNDDEDTSTKNWYPLPKIGTPLPKIGTNNITDNSDNMNLYNNLKDKELTNVDIIEKENTGFLQNPSTSKTLFSKNNKNSSTDLKHLVSDAVAKKSSENPKVKNSGILERLQGYVWKLDETKEVKEALCRWLGILNDNRKLMTKDQLCLAIEYLNRATKEDEVKIEAIKIASMKGYRDFEYTIDKAKESIHGKKGDFLHFGGKDKQFRKIEDIAKEQAEEFKKELEAHPEKYNVPEYF